MINLVPIAAAGGGSGSAAGRIPYVAADLGYTDDGALSWDATIHQLQVGTGEATASIRIAEIAAASAPAAEAGYGYLWVKNTAPSSLFFRDDAGTDYDLSAAATAIGAGTDNRVARYNGTNAIQDSGWSISDAGDLVSLARGYKVAWGSDAYEYIISSGAGRMDFYVSSTMRMYIAYGANNVTAVGASFLAPDDNGYKVGTSEDVFLLWSTTQTPDSLVLGLGADSNGFIICEKADIGVYDFAHAQQTNPTIFVHSANKSTTEWISFTHNQTNGVITTGAGGLVVAPAAGGILLKEAASATTDIAAYGQYWVESLTPNIPKFTDDAGTDFSLAMLSKAQAWTAGQTETPLALDLTGATTTLDLDARTSFYGQLSIATTELQTPSNLAAGDVFMIVVQQAAAGGCALTFTAAYDWGDSGTPDFTTLAASEYAIITGMVLSDGATIAASCSLNSSLIGTGTDNYLARYDGTVKLQSGGWILADDGDLGPTTRGYKLDLSGDEGEYIYSSGDGILDLISGTVVKIGAPILIAESAAAVADVAGYGQYWVLNSTANVPMFTDDAGTDWYLTVSTGAASAIGAGTDNYLARYDGTNSIQGGSWILADDGDLAVVTRGYKLDLSGDEGEYIYSSADNMLDFVVGSTSASHNFYFGATRRLAVTSDGYLQLIQCHGLIYDNYVFYFGTSLDAAILYSVTAQTPDTWIFGVSTDSRAIVVCENTDKGFDFQHAQQTNPTIFIQSANQSTTEWISFAHDQTNGVIATGAGKVKVAPASGGLITNDGTAAVPSYSFIDNPTVGVYATATAGLGLAVNGVVVGALETTGVAFTPESSYGVTVTQAAASTGTAAKILTLTGGAHTGQSEGTEVVDVLFDIGRTVTWVGAAITAQRAIYIEAPTYAMSGAATITDAATVYIEGGPAAGANTTITDSWALWIGDGRQKIGLDGVGSTATMAVAALYLYNDDAATYDAGTVHQGSPILALGGQGWVGSDGTGSSQTTIWGLQVQPSDTTNEAVASTLSFMNNANALGFEIMAEFVSQTALSANETALRIYDKDNDNVETVTVGSADSGGAGYKLLRIPN